MEQTPKEKAKELVDKYYYLFSIELENTIDYREAKQCALIAVDEILELLINSNLDYSNTIKYFQKVKQEIINC
jgi:predicted RNase H-like HicB family nuclease